MGEADADNAKILTSAAWAAHLTLDVLDGEHYSRIDMEAPPRRGLRRCWMRVRSAGHLRIHRMPR
jgi:hypothetical protein